MNESGPFERQPRNSFERALQQKAGELERFATPNQPLTINRLGSVNSRLVGPAYALEREGIQWPDAASSVRGSKLTSYSGEDADMKFAMDAYRGSGFNNFPMLLAAQPAKPREGENVLDFMHRNRTYAYQSKPYLHRAYAIEPEFMSSLASEVQGKGGLEGWKRAIALGAEDPESHPGDAHLLRGSRIAYVLLANLMRRDDLATQAEWFGLPPSSDRVIKSPETELFT